MNHDKILFWDVKKEAENAIIYTHYDTSTNFTLPTVIKQKDLKNLINALKNIKHDPSIDVKDNPDENILNHTLETIEDSDYHISLRIRKYNYSFENAELRLCSYWNNQNFDNDSIDIPYKDFEDLRRQLDSLIAEIEKVM